MESSMRMPGRPPIGFDRLFVFTRLKSKRAIFNPFYVIGLLKSTGRASISEAITFHG